MFQCCLSILSRQNVRNVLSRSPGTAPNSPLRLSTVRSVKVRSECLCAQCHIQSVGFKFIRIVLYKRRTPRQQHETDAGNVPSNVLQYYLITALLVFIWLLITAYLILRRKGKARCHTPVKMVTRLIWLVETRVTSRKQRTNLAFYLKKNIFYFSPENRRLKGIDSVTRQ